jgi:hypothetical protein
MMVKLSRFTQSKEVFGMIFLEYRHAEVCLTSCEGTGVAFQSSLNVPMG